MRPHRPPCELWLICSQMLLFTRSFPSPQAVLYPDSTEEVSRIVRAAAAARCPVIPFGAGTSLEGHIAALRGGICLDLSRMNRVLQARQGPRCCCLQCPGCTPWAQALPSNRAPCIGPQHTQGWAWQPWYA